ncbi:MAG TPA: ATP-binding protein, partial [Verrucomicrobiae bacterium]|nr:ATP-binding protein [Verrucomicrobiae bacterium]
MLRRCAVALILVAVAFAIRLALGPWLGEELPFMLFSAAALLAAAYGGAVPGFLALVLGLFLGDVFQESSKNMLIVSESLNHLRTIRYLFNISVGITLIEVLRRNYLRMKLEVAKRKASEAQLMEAKAELGRHAETLEWMVAERTSKLEASLKSIEGMVYHIAHNLRAPLRAMSGFANLLQEEYGSKLDDQGKEYTRRIAAASRQMDELIADLLAFGRLGYVEMNPEKTDLKRLIQMSLQHMAEKIRAKQAQVELIGAFPEVWVSRSGLGQALCHLLDNSLKFVAPGVKPRIQFQSEERGRFLRLKIQDNGIGVESAYHERIFQPFERLQGDAYEGTGIGLAIVQEAVHRMGGKAGV